MGFQNVFDYVGGSPPTDNLEPLHPTVCMYVVIAYPQYFLKTRSKSPVFFFTAISS